MKRYLPLVVAALASCGNEFEPVSRVSSIRILASRADKPYAKPGDAVALELLAVDGRSDRSRPMAVTWLPAPCINPPDDAYYNCYPAFEAAFSRGTDLTSRLVSGPRFELDVPSDILAQDASAQSGVPFGTVYAFSIACSGHVEYVGIRRSSLDAIPFACFDASGAELGPDDFVFAYSRVFVFADRSNENPVIEGLTLDGERIDPAAGVVLEHCGTPSGPGEDPTCQTSKLDVRVPSSSQERDPSNVDLNGNAASEALWVDYYVTGGRVLNDVRLLYDAELGKVSSAVEFEAPSRAGDTRLWTVVHDNRGGVNWLELPVQAR